LGFFISLEALFYETRRWCMARVSEQIPVPRAELGAVSTTLVWGGIKVAMLSSALGVLTLAFASLIWYVLQLRWRLLSAADREALA
jgi:hypothetical protein